MIQFTRHNPNEPGTHETLTLLANVGNLPKVTRIPSKIQEIKRYRLEGGDLDPRWAATVRDGHTAWCEISIWDGSEYVGTFGGEVWPAAWPALFECGQGTAQTGPWTRLTAAGRAALDAAS